MEIEVESATDPVWADADHTCITMQVKFAHLSEPVPFGASMADPEEHGRTLFFMAVNGDLGTIGEYVAPAPVPIQKTRFSSLEYLERFTEAEQLAIVGATQANPAVKLWYDKLLAAEYVDLADPRIEAGLSALVNANLLTDTRKTELMQPVTT